MFLDESRSSVLPLGKGQGELILWSVYTQCVLSLNTLIKASPQGSGQTATPAFRTLGWAKLPWLQMFLKPELKARCSRNFVKGRKFANSKYSLGRSPTNPGGLNLRGPVGLRQVMKADSRDRCSGLLSPIVSVGSKEWPCISSGNAQKWHGAHQLVPVD